MPYKVIKLIQIQLCINRKRHLMQKRENHIKPVFPSTCMSTTSSWIQRELRNIQVDITSYYTMLQLSISRFAYNMFIIYKKRLRYPLYKLPFPSHLTSNLIWSLYMRSIFERSYMTLQENVENYDLPLNKVYYSMSHILTFERSLDFFLHL